MEINPDTNYAILQYARASYDQTMPIASLDTAVESIEPLNPRTRENLIAHLDYLAKAQFLVIHGIFDIVVGKDDVHGSLGTNPGFQLTNHGLSYLTYRARGGGHVGAENI